jgi:hypothetical protein
MFNNAKINQIVYRFTTNKKEWLCQQKTINLLFINLFISYS